MRLLENWKCFFLYINKFSLLTHLIDYFLDGGVHSFDWLLKNMLLAKLQETEISFSLLKTFFLYLISIFLIKFIFFKQNYMVAASIFKTYRDNNTYNFFYHIFLYILIFTYTYINLYSLLEELNFFYITRNTKHYFKLLKII